MAKLDQIGKKKRPIKVEICLIGQNSPIKVSIDLIAMNKPIKVIKDL